MGYIEWQIKISSFIHSICTTMNTLTVQPPDMEGLSEDFRKASIDSSTPNWHEISNFKLSPNDHRGSMQRGSISIISDDSRRQSLFVGDAESQLTKILSIDSSGMDAIEEGSKISRADEIFTDKARAAMVVIGTKDIKEALEKKKADEVFRRSPEAKSAAVFFQQARFLVHQSRFKEALVFINKALQVDKERKEWMTERSLCYFKMLKPESALKYVDDVLELDPKYFQALLLKGEILYSMWDLERAMLCFVEGRRLRPENTDCIKGVHKIRMALEEISAYRDNMFGKKHKKALTNRSKSAKERSVSSSPSRFSNILSPSTAADSFSQHYSSQFSPLSGVTSRSSSTLSCKDEVSAFRSQRPLTAYARRKSRSSDMNLRKELTYEGKATDETASHRFNERRNMRPMTSFRKKSTTHLQTEALLDTIVSDLSGRSSRSASFRSDISFLVPNKHSEIQIDDSDDSASSSMVDSSKNRKKKKVLKKKNGQGAKFRSKSSRMRPTSCTGPKIAAALGKDRTFLESFLKNKGLRKAKTPYTKKALRIARELHNFVVEREEYWNNRERFIRYTKSEDAFLA